MKAKILLLFLTHLTLAGYSEGEYEWIGTKQQWNQIKQ